MVSFGVMKVEQVRWSEGEGWRPQPPGSLPDAQLVLVFGSTARLEQSREIRTLLAAYPVARLVGCSTAGEIEGVRVLDDSLVVTAVHFDHSRITGTAIELTAGSSFEAGETLARNLAADDLAHVFVLSEGLQVNGSALVAGLRGNLPPGVTVSGGLSGDGVAMERTVVLWGDAAASGRAVAIGFHGKRLRVGVGSLGGWDSFGPERLITRSKGNVLFELDGRSALELYKRYLGDHAHDLPAAGLLFPLSVRGPEDTTGVVRTILGIDEQQQSLTFAGDVPEGAFARLMKANFNRLLDGAAGAAEGSRQGFEGMTADLAILISCFGRRMVLKQRTEEEVEAVREVLGEKPVLTGFYSYGEISPFTPDARCELHNQTMTITALSET